MKQFIYLNDRVILGRFLSNSVVVFIVTVILLLKLAALNILFQVMKTTYCVWWQLFHSH